MTYDDLPARERAPERLMTEPITARLVRALTECALDDSARIRDAAQQMLVSTATWGLALWEDAYGLDTDESRPLDVRRSSVAARIRGTGIPTVERIKEIVSVLTGSNVEVTEDYGNYTVRIKATVGIDSPPDLGAIYAALAPIIPAHLAWSYTITLRAETIHRLYTGFAVRTGRHISVSCEIPAELDVTYMTDETGNLLADEAGNRIIDEEE